MRDNSITISKAIAIILMVLAHTYFSQYANHWINMFHMPLFFFMSGLCFKEKYLYAPLQFVQQRFKGIYVPYVKWSLIMLTLHNVFYHIHIYDGVFGFKGVGSTLYTCRNFINNAMQIVFRMSNHDQLLGGYWFLRTLLIASLASFAYIKLIRLITKQFSRRFSMSIALMGGGNSFTDECVSKL